MYHVLFTIPDGQSRPNISGKIVSGIEAGGDPANGLTEEGRRQARDAGKKLKDLLLRAGCLPDNTLVSMKNPPRGQNSNPPASGGNSCPRLVQGTLDAPVGI